MAGSRSQWPNHQLIFIDRRRKDVSPRASAIWYSFSFGFVCVRVCVRVRGQLMPTLCHPLSGSIALQFPPSFFFPFLSEQHEHVICCSMLPLMPGSQRKRVSSRRRQHACLPASC
jgi:hypothetical protein